LQKQIYIEALDSQPSTGAVYITAQVISYSIYMTR